MPTNTNELRPLTTEGDLHAAMAFRPVPFDPNVKIMMFVDCSGVDLRPWWEEIREHIKKNGTMPEELDELEVMHFEVSGERRCRIQWKA